MKIFFMYLKIKELRKKNNLTQDELASKIGVSVRMFSEYEKGTAEISIQKLKNIADSLNVTLYELIGLNDENKLKIINEPPEHYNLQPTIKDELIQFLKSENLELKKDKNFLQKIIEKKFDLE